MMETSCHSTTKVTLKSDYSSILMYPDSYSNLRVISVILWFFWFKSGPLLLCNSTLWLLQCWWIPSCVLYEQWYGLEYVVHPWHSCFSQYYFPATFLITDNRGSSAPNENWGGVWTLRTGRDLDSLSAMYMYLMFGQRFSDVFMELTLSRNLESLNLDCQLSKVFPWIIIHSYIWDMVSTKKKSRGNI